MTRNLFHVLNETEKHSPAAAFVVALIDMVEMVIHREGSERLLGDIDYKYVLREKEKALQENMDEWISQ